ncbi:MAG: chitobiase/beta-hexosaminidase C-terminal domain-containing protein [Saprospiraceae bacterium]|nr:chitobiase/beta-hexosaminidase C-terminal domain-containing protein [Saprospiraceae bacterium]
MRVLVLFYPVLFFSVGALCQTSKWQPVAGHLSTPWTNEVSPRAPWPEYPRPNLVRKQWKNLNGLWQYGITTPSSQQPSKWDGQILVPFPIESALSGVKKMVKADQKLWYKTEFSIPSKWKNSNILLHFEAVDWACQVWVNGTSVGSHKGGYDPFTFNITQQLKPGKNELVVSVTDPTDKGWQPLGKQTLTPGGIFYTPVTGIWQTVWLEPVPEGYIHDYQVFPDIDNSSVSIDCTVFEPMPGDEVEVEIRYAGKLEAAQKVEPGMNHRIKINRVRLWEPGAPNLYDLRLRLLRKGRKIDEVSGYFGMRKIAIGKDHDDFTKMLLNNKFIFQNGPLDQGFWPDGIYTPPSEAAMKFDLEMIQKMGFNMLRKHVKVEPRRFYYWCDKMGLLVWQDMPNGDKKINPDEPDIQRSKESAEQFEFELKQLISAHFNHPSIVMWVPFNEGWGQYESAKIARMVKQLDPTRLVNNVSGWADRGFGDVLDWHQYPNPTCPPAEKNRAVVLGEFGGLGLKTEGHMWESTNWGYSTYTTADAMLADYEKYYGEIWHELIPKGLSASVYTQITDVETEANGLMTYDRRVCKIAPEVLNAINAGRFVAAPRIEPPGGMINPGDTVRILAAPGADIRFDLNGNEPNPKGFRYTGPIRMHQSQTLKTRTFSDGSFSRTVSADFVVTRQKKPEYRFPWHPKYKAGGSFALIDGVHGSDQFNDGKWQGFSGDDLDVLIELDSVREIKEITAGFLENTQAWIFYPQNVTFSVSLDGKNFEPVGLVQVERSKAQRPPQRTTLSVDCAPKQVRYIKVKASSQGVCPDWHPGKGQKCWLFVDEIKFN